MKAIEEPDCLRNYFDGLAGVYRRMNRLMSFGMDVYWRRYTVRKILAAATQTHLDIACGTGEIPLLLQETKPEIYCLGLDFSWFMLKEGRGVFPLLHADALQLPLHSDCLDSVSIAFGFRNMGDYGLFLQEVQRVLRPGGRLYILELTRPSSLLLKPFFLFYLYILPLLAVFCAGKFTAYNYLSRSVKAFLDRKQLLELLEKHGYIDLECQKLSFGVATLFCGTKKNFSR